jgi:anti-sigma regulatory factor (Ser/Thr protein kinase)
MGQLRTALRAYAINGNSPGRTLKLLDRYTATLAEDAMATAMYAVVDSNEGLARIASAGHLPPIVISEQGEPRVVALDVAPPIGAWGVKPCPEQAVRLGPGEVLLLYTDGLIERPRIPLTDSIEELREALRGARTPEDACLMAMDRLVPDRGPRDDVAVIAIRIEPATSQLELEISADPWMLTRLRHALGRWLHARRVDPEVATEITIAVNEASANAIEHAYGPLRGKLRIVAEDVDAMVNVRVTDWGRWREPRGTDRGRGLKIMRAAMDSLDIRHGPTGTEVVMSRKLSPR